MAWACTRGAGTSASGAAAAAVSWVSTSRVWVNTA
jgi:hypothetical protein